MRPGYTLISTLVLPLLLALPAPEAGAAPWDPGVSAPLQGRGRSWKPKQAKRGKNRIFGGAKVRLTGPVRRRTVNPQEAMAKVRELQIRGKSRALGADERVFALADEEQLRGWFTICDHNANGWISFSESAHSLRCTRGRFQHFDLDRDGRLIPAEFQEYYLHYALTAQGFTAPRRKKSSGPPPQRTPEQVRNAYDADLDGGLNLFELKRLLIDYDQEFSDPERLLAALDSSGDQLLTIDELEGLGAVLSPSEPATVDATDGHPSPKTIADLFGQVTSRGTEEEPVPGPPQIVGPVGHFRRLDLDDDGYISLADLELLGRPVRVRMRPGAVLSTLDRDGDMRLDMAEFLAGISSLEERD